jgi:hypothetical protein
MVLYAKVSWLMGVYSPAFPIFRSVAVPANPAFLPPNSQLRISGGFSPPSSKAWITAYQQKTMDVKQKILQMTGKK